MNGKFYALVEDIADIFYLNVLWLICSLPIITIGASTTALLYVSMRRELGEDSYILKDFFRSFKENFLESSYVWVIMLLLDSALVCAAVWCLRNGSAIAMILLVLISFAFIICALVLLYIFALLARFKNTLSTAVINAFLISIKYWKETLFMAGLILAIIFLIYMVPYLAIAVLLFGVSGYARFSSHRYLKIFDNIKEVADGKEE